MGYELEPIEGSYAACRLGPEEAVPAWASVDQGRPVGEGAPLLSITRTGDELSIVCPEGPVPERVERTLGWVGFRVRGKLDHGLTGVLVSIAGPLADAGIPILAISSFDTDYVLVPGARAEQAYAVLAAAGHTLAR